MGCVFQNALIKESFYNAAPSDVIKTKAHQQEEAALEWQAWWNHRAQWASGQALLGYRGCANIWLRDPDSAVNKICQVLAPARLTLRSERRRTSKEGRWVNLPIPERNRPHTENGLKKTGKEGLPGSEVRDCSCEEEQLSRRLTQG